MAKYTMDINYLTKSGKVVGDLTTFYMISLNSEYHYDSAEELQKDFVDLVCKNHFDEGLEENPNRVELHEVCEVVISKENGNPIGVKPPKYVNVLYSALHTDSKYLESRIAPILSKIYPNAEVHYYMR